MNEIMIEGKAHLANVDIFALVDKNKFYNATSRHGWKATVTSVWPLDVGKVTLRQWLESQSWYNAKDVIKATGLKSSFLRAEARKHKIKLATVTNGKWRPASVALLFKALGIFAECPKCGGLAALNDGAINCLECGKIN